MFSLRFRSLQTSMMPVRQFSGVVCFGVLALMGCSALDVNDPTRVTVETLGNPFGASYAIGGSRNSLMFAHANGIWQTGLVTDEFFADASPSARFGNALIDLRESATYEASITTNWNPNGLYNAWQKSYRDATFAQAVVRAYAAPQARNSQLGEAFAIRGFTLLGLAEQICPGFPVRDIDVRNLKAVTPLYTSAPQTTDSAFTRSLADFDSAIVYAADSARILNFARIGKARALLGLGRLSEAGAVASGVPTEYVASEITAEGVLYGVFRGDVSVSNREGSTGLDFISAGDPRMPTLTALRHASNGDTTVWLQVPQTLVTVWLPSIVLASGIEARLIEAEAQLASGGAWLATLNALRSRVALSDTTDPGTLAGRVNLLFRERAFWLFGTGHRLGDVRRLIRSYARNPETVFPSGTNRVGASYAAGTSIPFEGQTEHIYNSAITGCKER